ncbi:UNVERIFIED_CONTAM: Splicing factor [Siphonaria sp. JEL0065]|nr:Splicing factor [Siphonaria sp. JEL0065]
MQSLFPLTEELWTDWLNDEIDQLKAVFSGGIDGEDLKDKGTAVLGLFEAAVGDYLSIPLWVKYLTFVQDSVFPLRADADEDDETPLQPTGWLSLPTARQIFQTSLQQTGHHYQKSHLTWKIHRDFELLVLNSISAKTAPELRKKQIELVRALYLDRLSTPHEKLDETFQDYSPFETMHDNLGYEKRMKHASSIKSKTARECGKRELSERKLKESGESLHGYLELIEFWSNKAGANTNDMFYLRTCWERGVAVWWNDVGFWERYIVFLMNKLRVTPVVMGVLNRAVRNCSWSGELWGHRLRIGEILGEAEEELNGKAYNFIIESKSADQYVILAKNRCGLVRRRVLEEASSASSRELLRNAHQEVILIFRQGFGDVEDFRVEQAAIHDEIHLFNDIARARSIYDTLLLSHPTSPYIYPLISTFERHHGRNLTRAHWILKQGLAKQQNEENRLVILNALVEFERGCGGFVVDEEEGDRNEFYGVLGKVKSVEWGLVVQRQKVARKQGWNYDYGAQQLQASQLQVQQDISSDVAVQQEVSSAMVVVTPANESNKRSLEEDSLSLHRDAKKSKKNDDDSGMDLDVPPTSEKLTVKKEFYVLEDSNAGNIIRLVNVKPETDCSFFKTLFHTQNPPVDYYLKAQEDGTTDGFIEFAKTEDAVNAAVRDKVKVFGEHVEIQRCIPAKKKWDDFDGETEESAAAEKRKVYVSNLDVGVDKPLLRQVFGHYGKLREIRLVLRQSIAFAYIEFEIGRSAEKAVELDGKTIPGYPGRKVGVAIADKSKTKKREADLRELFVTNFTIATTKQDLQGLFAKYGKIKDIRLLLDQSGVPRGIAFVEFEDEESAKSALQVNGTEIDGKFISVARSDPNARGGAHAKQKSDRDGGDRDGGQQHNRPGLGHPGRGGRGGSRGGRGGHQESAPTSASATIASFVPRTASRKVQAKVPAVSGSRLAGNITATQSVEKTNSGGGGKSQDDFRRMLLTKK